MPPTRVAKECPAAEPALIALDEPWCASHNPPARNHLSSRALRPRCGHRNNPTATHVRAIDTAPLLQECRDVRVLGGPSRARRTRAGCCLGRGTSSLQPAIIAGITCAHSGETAF